MSSCGPPKGYYTRKPLLLNDLVFGEDYSWTSHPNTLFTKKLCESAGRYSEKDVGEDLDLFNRMKSELNIESINYPIDKLNRFFIIRGTSQYYHTAMGGGFDPLDTTQKVFTIRPSKTKDLLLRSYFEKLIHDRINEYKN